MLTSKDFRKTCTYAVLSDVFYCTIILLLFCFLVAIHSPAHTLSKFREVQEMKKKKPLGNEMRIQWNLNVRINKPKVKRKEREKESHMFDRR